MSVRPSPVELSHALQRLVDSGCPGHQGCKVVVLMPGGRRLRFELGAACLNREDADDMESNVLEALGEAGEPLTGEKLAEVAGYQFSGAFKRCLKSLVDSGRVVNARPGYTLAVP